MGCHWLKIIICVSITILLCIARVDKRGKLELDFDYLKRDVNFKIKCLWFKRVVTSVEVLVQKQIFNALLIILT